MSASEKREGRSLTDREIELHKAAEGTPLDYEKITVIERKPTVQELKTIVETYRVHYTFSDKKIKEIIDDHPAISLHGVIYISKNSRNGDKKRQQALLVHEIEHQAQYQNGNAKEVLEQLIREYQMPDPYNTPDTLEHTAQTVEDKALDILMQRRQQ